LELSRERAQALVVDCELQFAAFELAVQARGALGQVEAEFGGVERRAIAFGERRSSQMCCRKGVAN
jgi:hypothetical protein